MIYIIETESFDIIVCNAMIFSLFSILYRIFESISRKTKQNSILSKPEYHYRVKKLYIMKIECDKLQSYHRYTHSTITDVLCRIFGIDNVFNNIEVFYIYPIRQGLIVYMEVSNYGHGKSKLNLFQSILKLRDDQEGSLNESFKLELDQCLNLGIKSNDSNVYVRASVNDDEIIGNRIKIFVKHEENKLSVNRNAVVVPSQPGSP